MINCFLCRVGDRRTRKSKQFFITSRSSALFFLFFFVNHLSPATLRESIYENQDRILVDVRTRFSCVVDVLPVDVRGSLFGASLGILSVFRLFVTQQGFKRSSKTKSSTVLSKIPSGLSDRILSAFGFLRCERLQRFFKTAEEDGAHPVCVHIHRGGGGEEER